jgi:SGNH domain (fused to AT3 domains)
VLSARPLVAIGLRSYSLYLWHWPVRVFVAPRPGLHGVALFALRLPVSVVLAEISFRVVERPFRTGTVARRTGSRGAIAYFVVLALVAGGLVATVAAPAALPTSGACPNAHAQRVDLFGDSTALVFGLAGCNHARELDVSVGGAAQLGCGVVFEENLSLGRVVRTPRTECKGLLARWQTAMQNDPHAALVLMTGAWDVLDQRTKNGVVRFGTPAWHYLVSSSLERALRTLTASGRTVYLFEVPCYGEGDPAFPLPERADTRRIDELNAIYDSAARTVGHVTIVHWRELVCPGGKRAEEIDGARLWEADNVHLTDAGALAVWRWFLPQVRAR